MQQNRVLRGIVNQQPAVDRLRREAGGAEAVGDGGERLGRRQMHDEMSQAERTGRRWRRADAGPGIQADVMVIAAGGDEQRARTVALHQLEAEHADVERVRRLEAARRGGAHGR